MADPGPSGQLLAVAEAQQRLFALASKVAAETVPLREAAGRWTAADIAAMRTQPASDLSAMDGYAIRFADLPGPFTLIGESAAGRSFTGAIGARETVRIFTGAAVPEGADCILIQEDTGRDGDSVVVTGIGPKGPADNIRRQGLDFTIGELLVPNGERMTPARVALAAVAGHGTLPVARRLRVATVSTGDELVPPGTTITGSELPESNGVMLAAMLADLPVDIVDLGILPDRLETITHAFDAVDADILVTTGGASVGDHDLVRPALEAAGGILDFWRIALRPGKPMMAGRLDNAIVLGLPGNPVSAFVTTLLFLRPLIAALSGARDPGPRTTRAVLGAPLPPNDRRQDYLRAETREGQVYALGLQDSSMLRTLSRADCLIVREPHAPAAAAGEMADILTLC